MTCCISKMYNQHRLKRIPLGYFKDLRIQYGKLTNFYTLFFFILLPFPVSTRVCIPYVPATLLFHITGVWVSSGKQGLCYQPRFFIYTGMALVETWDERKSSLSKRRIWAKGRQQPRALKNKDRKICVKVKELGNFEQAKIASSNNREKSNTKIPKYLPKCWVRIKVHRKLVETGRVSVRIQYC